MEDIPSKIEELMKIREELIDAFCSHRVDYRHLQILGVSLHTARKWRKRKQKPTGLNLYLMWKYLVARGLI